jgi:saccharopine dehydrogenase-like NADP-dependent oxidoreductase
MKKIAVVGGGKIGSSIYKTLQNQGFLAQLGDINPPPGGVQVNAADYKAMKEWLSKGFEVILCATPYYLVKMVATVAADLGIAYFDLTEDRDSTDYVKSLKSDNVIVPQCGLAPGAVSIIAANLIGGFDKIKSVDIRVGALPLFPNNSIQYYLTWSTNGLVNEYCNLCEVIHNAKRMDVMHHLMKFLLDDLNLAKNRELFIQLFDQEVPQTTKDVVIVMVKVIGYKGKKLMEETYSKKVYGDNEQSAIQKTTVGGICGAMMSWMTGQWKTKSGFVKQEEIDWHSFTNNFWGGVYRPEEDD